MVCGGRRGKECMVGAFSVSICIIVRMFKGCASTAGAIKSHESVIKQLCSYLTPATHLHHFLFGYLQLFGPKSWISCC